MDPDQFFVYFMIGFPIFMVTTMICTFTWVTRHQRQMMQDAMQMFDLPMSRPRSGPSGSSSDSPGFSSYDHSQSTGWYTDSQSSSYSDSGYSDSSSYSSSDSSSSCDTSSSSSSSDSGSSSSSSDSSSFSC